MGFTNRKPWTITEKDVAGKWGLGKDTRLKCYLCDKIAAVGDTFRWLYMNGHSPSPGNVMCCAGCDHVGIEDEIRAALVAWQKDFPGCNYEIRPAMKLAALEAELAEALEAGEWRPIAEAPKDKSPGLLLALQGGGVVIGHWNEFKGRWVLDLPDYDHEYTDIYTPTHWRPLPAPPEVRG